VARGVALAAGLIGAVAVVDITFLSHAFDDDRSTYAPIAMFEQVRVWWSLLPR
jgi:hypothetical protein